MKNNFQQVFRIGFILMMAAFIVVLISHIKSKNEVQQLEIDNSLLVWELERTKNEFSRRIKNLEENINPDENKPANLIELHTWDIEEMRRRGLKNPVKDIISDLRRHRELIPYEGSLGGTMNFYSENQIRILTQKWVLAYFEDGHNGGYLLLEYEVTEDGRIKWKALASYLA